MSTDYTCLIPLVPWVITTRFIFQNLFIERSGYQQIRLLAPGFTRLVIWRKKMLIAPLLALRVDV